MPKRIVVGIFEPAYTSEKGSKMFSHCLDKENPFNIDETDYISRYIILLAKTMYERKQKYSRFVSNLGALSQN